MPGGDQSGDWRSDTPLAGGRRPEADSDEHRIVAGDHGGAAELVGCNQPIRPSPAVCPTDTLLAPWSDQVYRWFTGDRLQVTRILELLAARGCRVSYPSLQRFMARRGWQRRDPRTVRMESSAQGEVAELDFGRLGYIEDAEGVRRRVVWALIVVLAHLGTALSGPPTARGWKT